MTLQKLASAIAKREGKKSQARIGDIREILSILSELVHKDLKDFTGWEGGQDGIISGLYKNGQRKAWRKRNKE